MGPWPPTPTPLGSTTYLGSSFVPGQVVALGLVSGEHAYLQSSWNVLDGLLVLVSLVDIVVAMASAGGAKILGILRVLRLLRTLRPLRWAWRGQGRDRVRGGAKGGAGARMGGEGRGVEGRGLCSSSAICAVACYLGGPNSRLPLPCAGSSAVLRASS